MGAAARAFNYTKHDIFNCCYGPREDIDGDKFTFIEGNIAEGTLPFNLLRTKIEAELTARSKPVAVAEITDVNPAPPKKRVPRAKPVRGIADDGTTIEFESCAAAEKAIGVSTCAVSKAARKGLRIKGYRWEYIQEDIQ